MERVESLDNSQDLNSQHTDEDIHSDICESDEFDYSSSSDDSDLDETWEEEFRNREGLYDKFYKTKNDSIKFIYLYINKDDSLEYIKSDIFNLQSPNIIKKEAIANIINSNCKNKKYKLFSILKFNIDSEPEDILSSLIDCKDEDYIDEVSYTNDIVFSDTVYTFQDLNTLFILLKEKNTQIKRGLTRKLRLKTHNKTKSLHR